MELVQGLICEDLRGGRGREVVLVPEGERNREDSRLGSLVRNG